MPSTQLRVATPQDIHIARRAPVDAEALAVASTIVEDVRARGLAAILEHAERLGDLKPGDQVWIQRPELLKALDRLPRADRELLERFVCRVETFARAQLGSLKNVDLAVEGGRAGHRWMPVESVGAYAPGGRYPLPSSVMMTVVPARVAGVQSVWVASPRPVRLTLAAAALSGADGVLACGGAQAIAALAFGVGLPAADLLVGPGNRFVTAAKKYLVGEVGIDALAGPSELLVLADDSADPAMIAADLLAQAEHDPQARVGLIANDRPLIEEVNRELELQLQTLSTAEIARAALANGGWSLVVADMEEALTHSDRLAPEHLEICTRDSQGVADRARCYGALFIGAGSAEVLGDYGAGPNHVLPTGGSARFQAGLSVATFLRASTYLAMQDPSQLAPDAARLARLEGLQGHARSAERRTPEGGRSISPS